MSSPTINLTGDYNSLSKQLITELRAMVQFAAARGEKIPAQALIIIKSQEEQTDATSDSIKKLVHMHGMLSGIVKPALPRNIVYLQQRKEIYDNGKGFFRARFPFQQRLALFSCFSILVLIMAGQSNLVNAKVLSQGILDSSGLALIVNFTYLCSCGAIGASFLILSNLKTKYQDGTYNPDQDVNSWTIILLGVISGIILSQLIPIDEKAIEAGNSMIHYNRGLFALLGGFSSKLIYDVLNKIIGAVGSIVNSDGSTAENDVQKLKLDQQDELNKTMNSISSKLVALKSKVVSGGGESNAQIIEAIDSLNEELGVPAGNA